MIALTAEQNAILKLIVATCPESIKQSPVILDVIEKNLDDIVAKKPEKAKSLFLLSFKKVLVENAISNWDWKKKLEGEYIDHFADSMFNTSPEIMMAIFDVCEWSPAVMYREAKILIKSNLFNMQIGNKTYFSITYKNDSYSTPDWFPYLLRHLCKVEMAAIDFRFEGPPDSLDQLTEYSNHLFHRITTVDLSRRNDVIYKPKVCHFGYEVVRGTVRFSAHANRQAGTVCFTKLNTYQCDDERDINEMMKEDIGFGFS